MDRGSLNRVDIGKELADSYRTVMRNKQYGIGVEEFLNQTTMLEEVPPAQKMLLEMFVANKRSALKMSEAMQSMLDALEEHGDPRQVAMFEGAKPTAESVIRQGINDFEKQQAEKTAASERYSLRELPDGKKYVHVERDQHLFDGASVDQYPRIARRYIMEYYSGKVLGDHTRAYVRKESANEFVYPAKKNMLQQVRDSKLRASTELENIVEAGVFIRHEADRGSHPGAVRGWDYYNVIYQVGDRFFEGETQIKKIARGDIFYDITKIEDITNSFTAKYGENP